MSAHRETISRLMKRLNTIEKALLSGREDPNSAFLEIHGAGGLDIFGWAECARMYLCWAEKEGFKTRIIDIPSDEAADQECHHRGGRAVGVHQGRDRGPPARAHLPFDANKGGIPRSPRSWSPEVDMSVVKIDEKD